MQTNFLYSRRELLKNSVVLTGLASLGLLSLDMITPDIKKKYSIGACDWSIGERNEVEALALAKKIGLDGVMVSLGSVANNMHLRQNEVQRAYLKAVKKYGVKISSLAIGELNNVPYKSEPETEEWVSDSIDVAKALGCTVVLLAFFGKGDLRGDETGIREVIRRLKIVAPKAEKAGVILGIESWLSADEHLRIIDAIGSENVRVYYDVCNSYEMGYDVYDEMRRLGKEYICEVHAKENGHLLGQGKVDFVKVKKILDDVGYQGWIIMEGGIPPGANLFDSYVANNKYIRSVFNP
ncbi:MAG: sugar phosphate isomerase/epimerase family protein [Ginsengibacter sp.]